MNNQETRIKQAADEYRRIVTDAYTTMTPEAVARHLLEAADRELPRWPTNKSMRAYHDAQGERVGLRAAMCVDPIIQAAVAARDKWAGGWRGTTAQDLIDAVNKAGL